MSVCAFNSLPGEEHSNLFNSADFPTRSIKHLCQLKTHIYQHFLMTKQQSQHCVYLNHIDLCLTQFCYRLF